MTLQEEALHNLLFTLSHLKLPDSLTLSQYVWLAERKERDCPIVRGLTAHFYQVPEVQDAVQRLAKAVTLSDS